MTRKDVIEYLDVCIDAEEGLFESQKMIEFIEIRQHLLLNTRHFETLPDAPVCEPMEEDRREKVKNPSLNDLNISFESGLRGIRESLYQTNTQLNDPVARSAKSTKAELSRIQNTAQELKGILKNSAYNRHIIDRKDHVDNFSLQFLKHL